MPIISQADATTEVGYPGVERAVLVDATQGPCRYTSATWKSEGRVTTHIHPDSEEAMVIVEGSLEAILGDQVVTLGEGGPGPCSQARVRKPVRRYRIAPDGVELACVRPLREEAHWGLIRNPPLWIDKLTTNGRKPACRRAGARLD